MSGFTNSKAEETKNQPSAGGGGGGGGGGVGFSFTPPTESPESGFSFSGADGGADDDDDDASSFDSLSDKNDGTPGCFDGLMDDSVGSPTERLTRLKESIETVKSTQSNPDWRFDPRYLALIRDDSKAVKSLLESHSKESLPPCLLHVAILAGAVNSLTVIMNNKAFSLPACFETLFEHYPIHLVAQALKEKPIKSSLQILEIFYEQGALGRSGQIYTSNESPEYLLSILGAYNQQCIREIGEEYFDSIWNKVIPDYTSLTHNEWPAPDSPTGRDESPTLREIAYKSNNPWLLRYLINYAQMQSIAYLEESKQDNIRLTGRAETAESELAKALAQLKATDDKAKQKDGEIAAKAAESLVATEALEELRSRQNEKDRKAKSLLTQITKKDRVISGLRKEIRALTSKTEELRAEQTKGDSKKTSHEKEKRELISKIADLETEIASLRSEKEKTTRTLESTRTALTTSQQAIRKAKKLEEKTKLELTQLSEEVSKLKGELSAATRQIHSIEGRETSLQEQITSLNAENAALESLMKKNAAEAKPSREIEVLKAENEKLSAELLRANKEKTQMQKTHKQKFSAQQKGFNRSRERNEATIDALKKKQTNLKEAFDTV